MPNQGKVDLHDCNKSITFKCYVTEIAGIGLIVVGLLGSILVPSYVVVIEDCIFHDYTNCWKTRCPEPSLDNVEVCVCLESFELTRNLKGNVIMYYELLSYDQTDESYAKSRDDQQLSGHLSRTPSSSCGNYSYVGSSPIVPCGAVADSMFTDSFSLALDNDYIPFLKTGMIDESIKIRYKNPSYKNTPSNNKHDADEDLKKAVENFARPIHWRKNLWDLDEANGVNGNNNNGFLNEGFIAWMETSMKRKPAWRLNRLTHPFNGLLSNTYSIRIEYNYPLSLYNGTRRIALCGDSNEEKCFTPLILWLCLIAVGIITAAATRPVIKAVERKINTTVYNPTSIEDERLRAVRTGHAA